MTKKIIRCGLWLTGWTLGVALCGGAPAQEAGDYVLQAGYAYVHTLDSSRPLHTTLKTSPLTAALGITSPFDSPGTSSRVGDSSTPFISLKRFVTDHIAVATDGGLPARFKLYGGGVIRPTGATGALLNVDLGDAANNPLASVKQWTPAVFGQYYFGAPHAGFRPYLGVGVSYTWFTEVNVNGNFQTASENNFGVPLALANGKAGPTHVTTYASSSFQPVFNAGTNYNFNRRWSLVGSVSYALLHTRADIKIKSADDTVLADSTTRIQINPLVLTLFISYNYGGGIGFLER